jgi:hypothetical protein
MQALEKAPNMNMPELIEAIMALPAEKRLDLAHCIIASFPNEREVSHRIALAVSGIEELVTGKVAGLNEIDFRAALK